MFTLEDLAAARAEIDAKFPQPLFGWKGQVSRTAMLPYKSPDPETGEEREAHAVLVGGVMFVSPRFWELLRNGPWPKP
jgi:hypothetical protein